MIYFLEQKTSPTLDLVPMQTFGSEKESIESFARTWEGREAEGDAITEIEIL